MKRRTFTGVVEVHAECDDCGWESWAKNAMGNAARHHDATGHVVRVEQVNCVRYGGDATLPAPAQPSLAPSETP